MAGVAETISWCWTKSKHWIGKYFRLADLGQPHQAIPNSFTFTYLTEDGRRWLLTAVELPREDA
jgi:hypothetical protein